MAKTGITFGAFECLHIGHIFLLQRAKVHCDRLIVVVSDDDWIREKKGHEPVFTLNQRLRALRSIREVDQVAVQSSSFDKTWHINEWNPDIVFVGSDHKDNPVFRELGTPVMFLERTAGISSTLLRSG